MTGWSFSVMTLTVWDRQSESWEFRFFFVYLSNFFVLLYVQCTQWTKRMSQILVFSLLLSNYRMTPNDDINLASNRVHRRNSISAIWRKKLFTIRKLFVMLMKIFPSWKWSGKGKAEKLCQSWLSAKKRLGWEIKFKMLPLVFQSRFHGVPSL